jgi:hypothetical protein
MIYPKLILTFGIVVFFSSTAFAQPVPCPDKFPTIGTYRNNSYGFQFEIPSNLKGYWNSAVCSNEKYDCICMTDHGRIIPLSNKSDIFIEAYAKYTDPDPEENSLINLRDSKLEQLKNDKQLQKVTMIGQSQIYLGMIPALRFQSSYISNGHKYIEDRIIAASDTVFELYLRTEADRYQSDVVFLEMILRTWKRLAPIE